MSQPAFAALAPQPLDFELVFDDGEPLESSWHYLQIKLLFDQLCRNRTEQRRTDVFIGANNFVYYSVEQARHVAETLARGKRVEVRGPDVFWISGVPDPARERDGWVAWEEEGRLPDVIFELFSKSNTLAHRKQKKELYTRVFRTAEYFVFGKRIRQPEGFRLVGRDYQPIAPDDRGRLWSEQLGLFVGLWHGVVDDQEEANWIRLYRPDGTLVPTPRELYEEADRRAEKADQRVEEERRRADAAEAELARLRKLLEEQGRS